MKHIKGIIQIIHGMSEHKDRYKHLFKYFSERGYLVVLKEHLHHGHNNIDQEKIGIFENDFNLTGKKSPTSIGSAMNCLFF